MKSFEQSIAGSVPRNVPEVHPWYALQVYSRSEITTAERVRARGYEVFLPTYRSTRRSASGTPSQLPHFPGYLFCRLDLSRRQSLITTPGVVSIVSAGRHPLEVDEAEIQALHIALASGFLTRPRPYLSVGDNVLIEAGPLRGLQGILIRSKNNWQVVLSVSLLQRSVCVEVPRESVSPVRKDVHSETALAHASWALV